LSDLLNTWNYLNCNEGSVNLLSPILAALANIMKEACDTFKKEDFKTILSLLPGTLSIIKNSHTMNPIMKHKLAVSFHKLLRSLLVLKDDKVLDIIDNITKLGSNDSCLSIFDSWKSISLFSFIKSNRDLALINKTVSDRFDMLVPKLLSFTSSMSPGAKLAIQHFYRHSLYLFMRYAQDVNCFNKPAIQSESDALLNYVHDSSLSWSKGILDCTAEEDICRFISDRSTNSQYSVVVMPADISASLKPASKSSNNNLGVIGLIKEDLLSLQHLIEDLMNRRDETLLQKLHQNLRNII
jgi:hypothetical protein